jgi:hypothetical protein
MVAKTETRGETKIEKNKIMAHRSNHVRKIPISAGKKRDGIPLPPIQRRMINTRVSIQSTSKRALLSQSHFPRIILLRWIGFARSM